jgi:hypothetical protein
MVQIIIIVCWTKIWWKGIRGRFVDDWLCLKCIFIQMLYLHVSFCLNVLIFCYNDFTFILLCVFVLKKYSPCRKKKNLISKFIFRSMNVSYMIVILIFILLKSHTLFGRIFVNAMRSPNLRFIFSYTIHLIINVRHRNVIE